MKLPLSIVMVASNEEQRIGRSLGSIADLASEIIVVINNTKDRTVKIAESLGARVFFEEQWHGFRDQKKIAVSHATQPWIFLLDADEEVSPLLKQSIINVISENKAGYAGGYCARKVWFLGRWIEHGDWYPDYCTRLWRKDKATLEGSPEHESIQVQGKVIRLHGDLYHYSNPTMDSWIKKMPYFSQAFLNRLIEKKSKWNAIIVILRSVWRWFRCYFLKLGFLDGYAGFYIACMQGFSTLYRYTRLYEHQYGQKKPPHWEKIESS